MQVDFYIIKADSADASFKVATRLIEKAHQKQLRALIVCNDTQTAESLDDWLWTFDETSFLPHCMVSQIPEGENPPIQIATSNAKAAGAFDILLNLSDEVLENHTSFNRILELVPADKKPAGRARYKAYREKSYQLSQHNI